MILPILNTHIYTYAVEGLVYSSSTVDFSSGAGKGDDPRVYRIYNRSASYTKLKSWSFLLSFNLTEGHCCRF